ncbi:MAG TPA: hypothetical protein QGH10_26075, partial [Armatimonadota bacterium]|nr:hypothetical protein [Armatimonadota bacterium]
IEVDLPTSEYTWGAVGPPNGRIYFGTYPTATLGEYDPATKSLRTWPQVAPNTKYACNFAVDEAGKIRFRANGPDEVYLTFDPETDEITQSEQYHPPSPTAGIPIGLEPLQLPEGDTSWRGLTTIGNQRFSVGHPSGRFCEIAPDGTPTIRGETEAFGEPAFWLEPIGDAVVGISYFGVIFRYDTVSGEFARDQMPNSAPGGNGLMFIEAVGGKWITGANYSQQNLFRVDYETGETAQPPWIIARSTGEPMCGIGFGDRLYTGIYTQSILMRYDTAEPFVFAENPRSLIELGETYNQTRPRAAVTDGELVFMTSDSAYNHIGGALCTIDPINDAIQVYHQLIQDQDMPTLAYDSSNRLLWGGTNRWGQMRSHPPTQESSLVYAFDPAAGELVATLTPWPGSDVTNVLGVNNGVVVAQCENDIALIDAATREILYQGALPVPIPRRIRTGADGPSYMLSGGTMYRWDLVKNALTPVAGTPSCSMLTEVTPGHWAVATSTTIYRISLD